MSQIRKDPFGEEYVIIATERAKRPSDYKPQPAKTDSPSATCPFCLGQEHLTPPEISSYQMGEKPWQVRVFANKFPAVSPMGEEGSKRQFLQEGHGYHEVIVESPEHEKSLPDYSEAEIDLILRAWQERLRDLMEKPGVEYVQIFKNHGREAGASMAHAHCQIITTGLVPPRLKRELKTSQEHYRKTGACLYCQELQQELESGSLIVLETGHFVAMTPFASRVPFEIFILPKAHCHDFRGLASEEREDLARVLKKVLGSLAVCLQDPPYNMMLHTSPAGDRYSQSYHWHLEILPHLSIQAGFEWGSGMFINSTPPELAAEFLRSSLPKEEV